MVSSLISPPATSAQKRSASFFSLRSMDKEVFSKGFNDDMFGDVQYGKYI